MRPPAVGRAADPASRAAVLAARAAVLASLATVLAALVACAPEEPPPPATAPRPVTAIPLREIDPVEGMLLTGAVHSWKEQDLSFEIEGVVRFVVEPGTNVTGRWVENGVVQVEGDVVARLDTREYEIRRDQAAAAVEVHKQQIEIAQIQLDKVLPASVRAAGAERDRSQAEFERYSQAAETNAVAEVDVIRARADRDAKQARWEEASASIDSKTAEIASLSAGLREAEQRLRQAEFDLERCNVYAPFSGEVSAVDVEAGGYARRGQAIVHLVMMMPIAVDLAVSSATAQRLRRGDVVQLRAPGTKDMLRGTVYEKSTTADPQTRTFRISIITQNRWFGASFAPDDPRHDYPQIQFCWPLIKGQLAPGEFVYYVEANRSLRHDAAGFFVWADPAYRADDSLTDGAVLTLSRFRVTPGPNKRNFQGLYLMQELTDIGSLAPGVYVPLDVPEDFEDGQKVVVARPQWLLRPGQLVQVLLAEKAPATGLYLPMDAIVPLDEGRGVVFVVDGDAARRVEVRLQDQVAGLVQIEGKGVAAGAEVIADYVHFLHDGDPVRVVRRREVRQ